MDEMKNEFENFRANVNREAEKVGRKYLTEKAGLSKAVLSVIFSGKRRFHQDHMEAISEALNIPLSELFLSPEQLDLNSKEAEIMVEINECLSLMFHIPEFRRAILSECDKLKRTFKEEVDGVKKKIPPSLFKNLK